MAKEDEEDEVQRAAELIGWKLDLIQHVCGSLLREPDFKDTANPTRKSILEKVEKIAARDPEFVLKMALYSRFPSVCV